jgi:hypothetical protein
VADSPGSSTIISSRPRGRIGRLVDSAVLARYLKALIVHRSEVIKLAAEALD